MSEINSVKDKNTANTQIEALYKFTHDFITLLEDIEDNKSFIYTHGSIIELSPFDKSDNKKELINKREDFVIHPIKITG